MTPHKLHNTYYALRHGQSMANIEKILSSDPKISTQTHGLSTIGKQQVQQSILDFMKNYSNKKIPIFIYTSDYLRALESSKILYHNLLVNKYNVKPVIMETKLRERGFGTYHGACDDILREIWSHDEKDTKLETVESVTSVQTRTSELILELEGNNAECIYFLVAHGDVLQILQTWFERMNGKYHRQLNHFETGCIREFKLKKVN